MEEQDKQQPVYSDIGERVDSLERLFRHGQNRHKVPTTPASIAATASIGLGQAPANDLHVHGHGSGYLPNAHHNQVHDITGTDHTASGLTTGYVIRATGATTFAWQQLQHTDLGGVTANQHHNQAHDITGADHTASGLTTGYVIRATGATTFAWGQLQHTDLGGVSVNQHHNQSHAHNGVDSSGTVDHGNLTSVSANQHHNQAHLFSGTDHTGDLTNTLVTYGNSSGLLSQDSVFIYDATNHYLGVGGTPQVTGYLQKTDAGTTLGASGAALRIINPSTASAGVLAEVQLGQTSTKPYSAVSAYLTNSANNTTGDLVFSARRVATDSTLTEILRMEGITGFVGINAGVTPKAQLTVRGAGQTTAAITDAGNMGGTIYLADSSTSAGDGGAALFGAGTGGKFFAGIKGLLTDGSNNTLGTLAVSIRAVSTDSALTQVAGFSSSGLTLSAMTAGSVLFAGTSGLVSQDNATFFWDDANNRLILGSTSGAAQLTVRGAGQSTAAFTDSGAVGGAAYLFDSSGAAGNGGVLLFGGVTAGKWFSAIKGLATDGSNNTTGDLAFSTRNATTDSALTERMRLLAAGQLVIGATAATTGSTLDVNGVVMAGDGSASVPGHTFRSDPDTGMFRTISNALDFSMGGTAYIRFGSAGAILPLNSSKTQDLGSTAARWNLIYYVTATTGTSRLAQADAACWNCGQPMYRGTGTMWTLGEDADYIPTFCLDCGRTAVEAVTHLPTNRKVERAPMPTLIFRGMVAQQHGGMTRSIRVDFQYGDNGPTNGTVLSEKEWKQFKNMTATQAKAFLRVLAQREWDALEETRLMADEVSKLQVQLDNRQRNWIGTALV